MSVTKVEKDPEALTMTITAELDATVEQAWQLWADPRQFEKWWGPPGFPASLQLCPDSSSLAAWRVASRVCRSST